MNNDAFRKYASICDFYESAEEGRDGMDWVVTDKIDGSHMTFLFEPGRKCQVASREEILGDWDKVDWQKGFFDACASDPRIPELIARWERRAEEDGEPWHLYGELAGPLINRRVWYGPHHIVRFFDMRKGARMLPWKDFRKEMEDAGFGGLVVPVFLEKVPYAEAIAFDRNVPDPIAVPEKPLKRNPGNIIEGVVLKAYDRHLLDRYHHRTLLRDKNPMFIEKGPRPKKPGKAQDPGEAAKSEAFCAFFNEARMLSCFSKKGRIGRPDQIGDYVKAILADMEEDFLKGDSWENDDWRKPAMKRATGQIAKALQASMREGQG